MTFKVKIKLANGEEHEVDLPEGYLPPDVIEKDYKKKSEVSAMVERLVSSGLEEAVAKKTTELKKDPAFLQAIFGDHNIPVDKDGKVVLPEGGIKPEDLQQRLQENLSFNMKQWEEQKLAPVAKERDALTGELDEMRNRILMTELYDGGKKANLIDDKFESFPGQSPYSAPVYGAASMFAWDPKTKMHALVESRDEKGNPRFKINPSGSQQRPYYGPQEYYTQIAVNEEAFKKGGWFKDERPSETNLGNPNAGPGQINLSTASDAELAKFVGAN